MNDPDDALTRLVAGADPAPTTPAESPTVDRAWAVIEAELRDDPAVTPLRRPVRLRRTAVVGAVTTVALAASAASAYIATRTGVWNTPEWIAAGGPGEAYRMDGTDLPSELAKLATDIPYPNEAAREASLKAIVEQMGGERGKQVAMHTGALRAELARGAICSWTIIWRDAGTADEKSAAVTALRGAMTWPAVTDVDPLPSIDGAKTDYGMGPTIFGHLPGLIDAAADGDEQRLKTEIVESAFCAVTDGPAPDASADPPPPTDAPVIPVATTVP